MALLASFRQFVVIFKVTFSIATHRAETLGNAIAILTTIGAKRLALGGRVVTTGSSVQQLVVVVHAQVILAHLARATVLILVTHGTLLGAVLGFAVAFAVDAVQHRMAAVAIAAPAAHRVNRLAILITPLRVLPVLVATVFVRAVGMLLTPMRRAYAIGAHRRVLAMRLTVGVGAARFALAKFRHANFVSRAFLVVATFRSRRSGQLGK